MDSGQAPHYSPAQGGRSPGHRLGQGTTLQKLATLLATEARIELRTPAALYGLLLYTAATCFIAYTANDNPLGAQWVALYWVLQLFVGVNAALKSFQPAQQAVIMWWYTQVPPRLYLVAKLLYNLVLLVGLSLLVLGLFTLFFPQQIAKPGQLLLYTGVVGAGLATVFTFVAAIGYRATNAATLTAVLAFPTVIPMLIMGVALTRTALSADAPTLDSTLNALLLTDVIALAAALLLFPYLWRE